MKEVGEEINILDREIIDLSVEDRKLIVRSQVREDCYLPRLKEDNKETKFNDNYFIHYFRRWKIVIVFIKKGKIFTLVQ